ncbi:uncharacterized protein LOC654863 [Tribolium castaneum]|uniref:Uncharacterized protein n=1 Tax=Tribolium castaneum TaxID=7070 RepID=D6WHA3_TRICA|nr:PREDICTED: uncharacterized protein LOC654863 [Tribolium castaneum]EFA00994.1 hypothetical protein TcasGA2_TC003907 [Tribolium castaneum]|eukprot:XP_975758.1 PREDICTED: uncharacterized protein LOC654863 [Tribolium castaneum]
MSQIQITPNPGDPPDQDDESWVDLLQNLTTFITASASLVNSLKHTIEVAKLQPAQEIQEEIAKVEAKTSTLQQSTSKTSTPKPSTSKLAVGSTSKTSTPLTPKTSDAAVVAKTSSLCVCKPKSKGSVKNNPAKAESFAKEKSVKLNKLKEDCKLAQKNLADIQEQVRQLERLYQDYESMNTPEGQVNPAALYKQIMKPQTVPYVPVPKTSRRPPGPESCDCFVSYKNKSFYQKPKDKVAVLSTIPYHQPYY